MMKIQVELNNQLYDVIVEKKAIKNMYLRIKDNMLYVTTSYFTTKQTILKFILNNQTKVLKMLTHHQNNLIKDQTFYYLGIKYNIIINPSIKAIIIEDNSIYIKDEAMLQKWLKQEIIKIFQERLDICYNKFNQKITYPNLKIRSMTTRWGVCNRGNNTVTLNSKLIRYHQAVIDYVIMHELSHFIHAHHQRTFWDLVGDNCPDYKIYRKQLKE